MDQLGGDFAQRLDHKTACVHARVRDDHIDLIYARPLLALLRVVDHAITKQEQVDVDHARAIDDCALASHFNFNFKKV